MEQDVKNVVQLLGMHSLNVCSLYIGGGTRTSLKEKAFARLLTLVLEFVVSPLSVNLLQKQGRPDCFLAKRSWRVEVPNRNQRQSADFHDKTLQVIGRKHTVADFIMLMRQ